MKSFVVLITLAGMALAAPADTKKKKAAPAPKAAPAAQMLTIPKGAVQNADGSYAFTDKQGKKWLYRRTPFGVSRTPDAGEAVTAAVEAPKTQGVKATDAGDTVKFERTSPFGPIKWEKKKADLTEEEKLLLPQQAPPAQPAPQQPE